MPISLDPEIEAALMLAAEQMAGLEVPERDDALALRAMVDETLEVTYGQLPDSPDVTSTDHAVVAQDGYEIPRRLYRRAGTDSAACKLGKPTVSPVAAPARLTDFENLAPAYIEVGELDIFRDESITYAHNLMRAGVCELRVYPGSPHGHDWLNPNAAVSKRAVADRVRLISTL